MAKKPRIEVKDIKDLEALGDYAIIEVHDTESVSKGGIVIPDKAKGQSWRGTVVRVGPGKTDNNGLITPMDIEVGDVVIYRNFQGWQMGEIQGTNYYAVSGEERIARIPKAKVKYL